MVDKFNEQHNPAGKISSSDQGRQDSKGTVNIQALLDSREREVRAMLLDEMVRQQRPLPLEELTGNGGSLPNPAKTIVKRLAEKGVVALDATAAIASTCRQCDAALEIHIEDEKIRSASPATVQVLHLDLRNRKDWAASC